MTPEEFKNKIEEIIKTKGSRGEGDTEVCHAKMDDLLCETLIKLGYFEGVKIFMEEGKWYA